MASNPVEAGEAVNVSGADSRIYDINQKFAEPQFSTGPLHSPTAIRRRNSAKNGFPAMKRAASTPNIRGLASGQSLTNAMDKRRNKLGYHRTSVACGHCRRRKIRCLMAPEDPTGKCQNCVRLKKDCNFFPVDQHPMLDRRPRSGSKLEASSNEAGTSDSSSPGMSVGRSVDRVDGAHNAVHPLPQPATLSQSIGVRPFEDPHYSSPSRALTSRSYDHARDAEPGNIWPGSTYLQQSPQPMAAEKHYPEDHNFWRPQDPIMPTSYPHPQYMMTPSTISVAPSSHSSAEQVPAVGLRDGHHWPQPPHPPLRSMSLVTPEEMPHYYQAQYQHDHTSDFSRRTAHPSEMQPPILASNAGPITEAPEQQPIPGMVPYHQTMTHQPMQFGYTPVWSTMPPLQSPHLQSAEPQGFTHEWYPDPAVLSQVKEEDAAGHFQQQQNSEYLPYQANPG